MDTGDQNVKQVQKEPFRTISPICSRRQDSSHSNWFDGLQEIKSKKNMARSRVEKDCERVAGQRQARV
eukprot:641910-Pelagomonas_calceolata.AAC.5